MSVALYYDPLFLAHETMSHPEKAARVSTAVQLIESCGLAPKLARPPSRDASIAELERIHARELIELIRHASSRAPALLDPDTVVSSESYAAAVRAAGSCLSAVEAVAGGEYESAFCLTRPPGHHATPHAAMGFCLFNSIAVAAAHAREALGFNRVAIVDIDLHHGNGTQEAFYGDGSVLYASTHQYPFYPGTGDWHENGIGAGHGATLNLPLPPGCGDAEYGRLMDEVLAPALRRFRPELLLVSAGFDAHFADSISGAAMRLSCAGYAALVARLQGLARELCDGRIVLALEGGYNLTAVAWCVRNSLETLLEETVTPDPLGLPPERHPRPDLSGLISNVTALHGL